MSWNWLWRAARQARDTAIDSAGLGQVWDAARSWYNSRGSVQSHENTVSRSGQAAGLLTSPFIWVALIYLVIETNKSARYFHGQYVRRKRRRKRR